jgi:hypothetical protein
MNCKCELLQNGASQKNKKDAVDIYLVCELRVHGGPNFFGNISNELTCAAFGEFFAVAVERSNIRSQRCLLLFRQGGEEGVYDG